jgi:hypothetical protein
MRLRAVTSPPEKRRVTHTNRRPTVNKGIFLEVCIYGIVTRIHLCNGDKLTEKGKVKALAILKKIAAL